MQETKFIPVTVALFFSQPSVDENGIITYGPFQEVSRRKIASKLSYKDCINKAISSLYGGTQIKLYEVHQKGLVEQLKEITLNYSEKEKKEVKEEPKVVKAKKTPAIKAPAVSIESFLQNDECKTLEDLPTLSLADLFIPSPEVNPEDPFADIRRAANPEGALLLPPDF